ncbi:hypothetical protein KC324_g57 [Hortaea werneckii]|nr:hypothetical protein KC324_g57 [Hortaea werneckii]
MHYLIVSITPASASLFKVALSYINHFQQPQQTTAAARPRAQYLSIFTSISPEAFLTNSAVCKSRIL